MYGVVSLIDTGEQAYDSRNARYRFLLFFPIFP